MKNIYGSVSDASFQEYNPVISEKKKQKLLKQAQDQKLAKAAVINFIQNNLTVNLGCVIKELKDSMISTLQCCKKLGISPKAFFRLRKKYNIDPIYVATKSDQTIKSIHPAIKSNKANKNFYTIQQINKISQEDIDLVKLRAARSLRFPNGENCPITWTPRGLHFNGKIKARTDQLEKLNIQVRYNHVNNNYIVRDKDSERVLSKQEVDKLNIKYKKMKAIL